MGFLEWLFGKEETKVAPKPAPEKVELTEEMIIGKKEEVPIKRYVKVTDLDSIDKIDKIRRDLLSGNIIVADIKEISKSGMENPLLLQMILKELKKKVDEVHGEIARLSDERLILIPSDMKFVRVAGKEE